MLDQLEKFIKAFGLKEQPRLIKILNQLSRRRFKDAESLIRFHECLLFILAYPQHETILDQSKKILSTFPGRIQYLKKMNADLALFEDPEMSGIAGTSITVMSGYAFAHWLSLHHVNEAEIDWEGYEEEAGIGTIFPRVLPLLDEEALVEAHFPFLDYIHSAKTNNTNDLKWLLSNFYHIKISQKQKAELYESLKLFIRFVPRFESSRTGLILNVKTIFYHQESLIQRSSISLINELNAPLLKINRISAKEGFKMLDIIRTASVVRFRELHGFIWGDKKSFCKVDAGRGVIIYLNEVLHGNRLPLRAYHSGFIFKNGVPVGYVEALSLFEKIELGFNLYYTFRDGETAWLYAQLLRIFKQYLGVTVFSVDPYQIGNGNKEGIASGAFWFYRKLGFHPISDEVAGIVEREEKKILNRQDYRTPAHILRKIAKGHLLYVDSGPSGTQPDLVKRSKSIIQNQWKKFHHRNIMLAVQKNMSEKFNGSATGMRKATIKKLSRLLDVDLIKLDENEYEAFSNFSLVLSLIPDISKWSMEEKKLMVEIICAKGSGAERRYLQLMQKHIRFRKFLILLGAN